MIVYFFVCWVFLCLICKFNWVFFFLYVIYYVFVNFWFVGGIGVMVWEFVDWNGGYSNLLVKGFF